MDLDFWECFGMEKLYLITEEIWYVAGRTNTQPAEAVYTYLYHNK